MRRIYSLVLFVFIAGCADNDMSPSQATASAAVTIACVKCHKSASEMQWLDDLIRTQASEGELRGNVYLIADIGSQPTIVFQPFIMSCGGCTQFDCAGNRRQPYALNIWSRMNASTLIYAPQ